MEKIEYYKRLDEYYNEKPKKKPYTKEKMKQVIQEIIAAKNKVKAKQRREYHLLSTYDVVTVGNQSHLIRKNEDVKKIECLVAYEELYDIIRDFHVNKTGHGGRMKMDVALAGKFQVPRPAIETFLSCCENCEDKKQRSLKKRAKMKPSQEVIDQVQQAFSDVDQSLPSTDFCNRGQFDLIDFKSQPDRNHKWILKYQDQSTKFVILRPLVSESVEEVASQLLDIFLLIGAPKILQSLNGRELTTRVIKEINTMWPEVIILNGRLQNNAEPSNQHIINMLRDWMFNTKNNEWSRGLNFIQWQINSSHQGASSQIPYKEVFGVTPKLGLESSQLPLHTNNVCTEEEFEVMQKVSDCTETKFDVLSNSMEASDFVTESFESDELTSTVKKEKDIDSMICCICFSSMKNSEYQCGMCQGDFHKACALPSNSNENVLYCSLCN